MSRCTCVIRDSSGDGVCGSGGRCLVSGLWVGLGPGEEAPPPWSTICTGALGKQGLGSASPVLDFPLEHPFLCPISVNIVYKVRCKGECFLKWASAPGGGADFPLSGNTEVCVQRWLGDCSLDEVHVSASERKTEIEINLCCL